MKMMMTQAQNDALKRWDETMASRPAPVETPETPTLDAVERIKKNLIQIAEDLKLLGVPHRGELTLSDLATLIKMTGV